MNNYKSEIYSCSAAALLAFSLSANAQSYELIGLGDLAGGRHHSFVTGITAEGVVIGHSAGPDGAVAVFWDAETHEMHRLGTTDTVGVPSVALSINASGTIVGRATDEDGLVAVSWDISSRNMQVLGRLPVGERTASAIAVDDLGNILGWSDTGGEENSVALFIRPSNAVDLRVLNLQLPDGMLSDVSNISLSSNGVAAFPIRRADSIVSDFYFDTAIVDLGSVDKRDSHRCLIVIQAGICDGDQLGTRPDVGRGVGVL